MRSVRHWAVRHPRLLKTIYDGFEWGLVALDPLWRRLGYGCIEKPVAGLERAVKGFLFDCRMCGQCTLSSTGLSCPMNCPKNLRNGPCGGVRADGRCEVEPAILCVWGEAWEGAKRLDGGVALGALQGPLDHRLAGSSAWLRRARERAAEASAAGRAAP